MSEEQKAKKESRYHSWRQEISPSHQIEREVNVSFDISCKILVEQRCDHLVDDLFTMIVESIAMRSGERLPILGCIGSRA